MTDQEIKNLPTILDVVEQLAARENKDLFHECGRIPPLEYYDEGRYNYVSDDNNRNVVRLMPTSQSPFTFMRGQSRYYDPCLPTLYRDNPSSAEIEKNRALVLKFGQLLMTHPVFQEVSKNVQVDLVAMAQHYGFITDYIDITNNKWVAAFFACTGYDSNTDTYYPVGKDYYDGYGVLYVTKEINYPAIEFYNKYRVVGYHYFTRPTQQSSFGIKIEPGEDFNDSQYFDKIFFRHDIEASNIVFDMAYKQKRFIPVDELSILARRLRQGEKVSFNPESLRKDWEDWNAFGREDLNKRILPIIPFCKL